MFKKKPVCSMAHPYKLNKTLTCISGCTLQEITFDLSKPFSKEGKAKCHKNFKIQWLVE